MSITRGYFHGRLPVWQPVGLLFFTNRFLVRFLDRFVVGLLVLGLRFISLGFDYFGFLVNGVESEAFALMNGILWSQHLLFE